MAQYSRTDDRKPELRKYINWTTCDRISRKTCLHVDVWFLQAPDDTMYWLIERRAGGWKVVHREFYRTSAGEALVEVPYSTALHEACLPSRINSKWGRKNVPWAWWVHKNMILPRVRYPLSGYIGHISVKMHYIFTDKAVNDPFEGIENHYAYTERAARDLKRMKPDTVAAAQGTRKALSLPRERGKFDGVLGKRMANIIREAGFDPVEYRSKLRTLDKLLKG